jgi:hypothetical protein
MGQSFLDRLRERRHLLLLLTLVATIVVQPLALGFLPGLIIYDVLHTLVVLIVFFIVFQRRRDRLVSMVFGLPVPAGGWALHIPA